MKRKVRKYFEAEELHDKERIKEFEKVFDITAPILSKYFEDIYPPYNPRIIAKGEGIKFSNMSNMQVALQIAKHLNKDASINNYSIACQLLMPHKLFSYYDWMFRNPQRLANKFQVPLKHIYIRKEVISKIRRAMERQWLYE